MYRQEEQEVLLQTLIHTNEKLFLRAIDGMNEKDSAKLKDSFEEFKRVAREVFQEYGDRASIAIIRNTIPRNIWLSMLTDFLKNRRPS